MAKIKTYLDNIKNAMFGRDVRDSIHNGIEAINEEVESTTIKQQDLESTFDELIINAGNSNAEIVDARVGANGTSYAKLGDRLNSVDSQIKDIENERTLFKNNTIPFQYGKIELPSDFNNITDFEFYRDADGIIKTTYKLENIMTAGATVYLSINGLDSNDGLTKSTAVRTLGKAIEIANTQSVDTVAINMLSRCVNEGTAKNLDITLNKNIIIQKDPGIKECYWGSIERNDNSGLTWINESNGIYSYSLVGKDTPEYILDAGILDYRGIPKELKKLEDNKQSNLNAGEWCINTKDQKVMIKPFKTSFIKDNILCIVPSIRNIFRLGSHTLAFKDIHFFFNSNLSTESQQGYGGIIARDGVSGSKFIFDNCSSNYTFRNGIYVRGINYTYAMNSTCVGCGADGFNYDGNKDGARYETIIEYNCHSYNNGKYRNSDDTNNATTAHGGVHILRINSVGYNSDGPTCSDVQGCYSILYDCHMRGNITAYPGDKRDASYYMSNQDQITGAGKVIMINCSSPKNDVGYGLSTDGDIDLYINNFRGKIKNDIPINYL